MNKEEIKSLDYSKKFLKSLDRLPKRILKKAERREKIFKKDPFDPRLETHKLRGREKEHWAFSVDDKYRIKFMFLKGEGVLFLDIGTHDIYR